MSPYEQASEARWARDPAPAPALFFGPSNLLVQTLCHVLRRPGRDPKKTLKGSQTPQNMGLAHLVPAVRGPRRSGFFRPGRGLETFAGSLSLAPTSLSLRLLETAHQVCPSHMQAALWEQNLTNLSHFFGPD